MAQGYKANPLYINEPFDCGFRYINAYDITVDLQLNLLAFKIDQRQYTVGFYSTTPIEHDPEYNRSMKPGEMVTPPLKGIQGCINVKTNVEGLLQALKELITDIENDLAMGYLRKEKLSFVTIDERLPKIP